VRSHSQKGGDLALSHQAAEEIVGRDDCLHPSCRFEREASLRLLTPGSRSTKRRREDESRLVQV
jgi:hypothetical protein